MKNVPNWLFSLMIGSNCQRTPINQDAVQLATSNTNSFNRFLRDSKARIETKYESPISERLICCQNSQWSVQKFPKGLMKIMNATHKSHPKGINVYYINTSHQQSSPSTWERESYSYCLYNKHFFTILSCCGTIVSNYNLL